MVATTAKGARDRWRRSSPATANGWARPLCAALSDPPSRQGIGWHQDDATGAAFATDTVVTGRHRIAVTGKQTQANDATAAKIRSLDRIGHHPHNLIKISALAA